MTTESKIGNSGSWAGPSQITLLDDHRKILFQAIQGLISVQKSKGWEKIQSPRIGEAEFPNMATWALMSSRTASMGETQGGVAILSGAYGGHDVAMYLS